MEIISKDIIEQWILPHLPKNKRGFSSRVPLTEIVSCIFYRLKTGCQWRYLPTKAFFKEEALSWNTVFYYWNKWSKAACWQKIWIELLRANKSFLDLSSLELDGSHTPVKRGGQAVAYQGRKACKTSNALFFSDAQGQILAMASPQAGNHHDLFEIQKLFEEMCALLKEADIDLKGLFLNADPAFDAQTFKQACQKEEIIANVKPNERNQKAQKEQAPYQRGEHIFDELLYEDRYVIERANAWLDAFKALLVRFEHSTRNWCSLHFMAFCLMFLRRIQKVN